MKILHYLTNFIFGVCLVLCLGFLALYNWRIGQILTLSYLKIICAFALFLNNFINSKF